jgi:hypothetical protein
MRHGYDPNGSSLGLKETVVQIGRRLGLSEGEVVELLERLPFGELERQVTERQATPEDRMEAQAALERYAARKRAVVRMVRRNLLDLYD